MRMTSASGWPPRRHALQNFVLAAATLAFCLVIGEILLRLLTPFPVNLESNKKPHPILKYVLDPSLRDVDQDGFRNNGDVTLRSADIVVIGDSHTYGENVSVDQDFPSHLSEITGYSVYNMGVGSYGIYQYKALLDMVASLKTRFAIVALYIANDLDYYCGIAELSFWKAQAKQYNIKIPLCDDASNEIHEQHTLWSWGKFLASYSALLSAIRFVILPPVQRYFNNEGKDFFVMPYDQSVRINIVQLHNRQTDLSNDAFLTNFRNSKIFFKDAEQKLNGLDTLLGIVMLPSKEMVVIKWAERQQFTVDSRLVDLVGGERGLAEEYKKAFDRIGIEYVDALPFLVDALDKALEVGDELYLWDSGHPLKAGYQAYAAAAAALVKRLEAR
jgi:hypothetical protein